MLAWIKKWLAPPVFEGDAEKTRRASFLNLTILITLSFLGFIALGSLFAGTIRVGISFTLFVLFGVVLFLYYLLRRAKVVLAGIGLMILVFLAIIIVEIINGTVRAPATVVFLFVIITAGVLFEWRGILLSLSLCSLAVLGLVLAENADMLPQPVHLIPLANWISYTGLFGIIGFASLWGQKTTQQALARAEQEIKARERVELELRKLTRAVEQSPASIVITDLGGNIEYVNPRFTQVTGYTSAEAVGKNPRFLKTYLTPPDTHAQLWQTLMQRKEWRGEFVNQKKDGSLYYEAATISPITDLSGITTHYLAVKEDITERKHAEDVLAQTAARLSLAVRAGGVGTWEYDILNDRTIWDDQMLQLYGISAQDFSGAYAAWLKGVHPLDRERGDNEFKAAQRGEKEYDTEFRVVWPDGSVHNIRALALLQRDHNGQPLSLLGTNWDITTYKQAQEQIAELGLSNQTLLNTVTDGIHVLDEHGNLVDANPAFCKMLGYTLEELKLLNVADWDLQLTPGELAIKVNELIDHPAMFETRHRRKDNVFLDVEINAVGIDLHGHTFLYASARDISTRKAAEDEIKLLNAGLEKLALTDFLTNLYNRRYFMQRGSEAVKRVMRTKEPLALLMLDVDWFKKVNDTYGHGVGDLALQQVALVLKSSLREIDFLARIGGEEFAVLLPNTDQAEAAVLADRIRKLMQDTPFETNGQPITITISLGAAVFEKGMVEIDDLLRNADSALYQAKHRGRNCVVIFQDNLLPPRYSDGEAAGIA
jgi:diguanylate cyclase (GGDEF)-like protein/PAS domain S-box-containing protein